MTSDVTEVISKIPVVEEGIKYIQSKYPVVNGKPVQVVKVTEYETEYQLNYVSEIEVKNPLAVVVKIDKKTGETS